MQFLLICFSVCPHGDCDQDIKRNDIEPIMFLSKSLTKAENNYWPTELEVAGLVWTVKKVRHMVDSNTSGKPTIVFTDHCAATNVVRG